MRPELLVFDVNETLLDMSPLRIDFEDVFGTGDAMGEWFARLLHGSLVANELEDYRAFGVIGVWCGCYFHQSHGRCGAARDRPR